MIFSMGLVFLASFGSKENNIEFELSHHEVPNIMAMLRFCYYTCLIVVFFFQNRIV